MIVITLPNNFLAERTYIVDIIFFEFLGLEYKVETKDNSHSYEIVLENGNTLIVKDHFFSHFEDGLSYLDEKNIPSKIVFLKNQFSVGDDIPVVYGDDELTVTEKKIICGIDIFASSFFMLTRWEEYTNKARDVHDRFPAAASLAYRNKFLNRSIVNEYVEMLWNMLKHLKCKQERKKRDFRMIVSHDVDVPFLYGSKDFLTALKLMGGDMLKRKNPRLAFHNFSAWLKIKKGGIELDPFYTFNDIMALSERFGLKSIFFFMTDRSHSSFDGDYNIGYTLTRRLIRDIHTREHEIGLHLSYGSFQDPVQTKKEFEILKTICGEEGIKQKCWGSRQHYLRWETPITFNNLEQANLDYDSTLCYADAVGFRCGVCYEYPVFHILKRKRLNVRERPLLVMECTVIDDRYMYLGTGEKAFSLVKSIKDTCRRFDGDFILLWHNTRLVDGRERKLYREILQA